MGREMVHQVVKRLDAQFLIKEFGLDRADTLEIFYVEFAWGSHLWGDGNDMGLFCRRHYRLCYEDVVRVGNFDVVGVAFHQEYVLESRFGHH